MAYQLNLRLDHLCRLCVTWQSKIAHIPCPEVLPTCWGPTEAQLHQAAIYEVTADWDTGPNPARSSNHRESEDEFWAEGDQFADELAGKLLDSVEATELNDHDVTGATFGVETWIDGTLKFAFMFTVTYIISADVFVMDDADILMGDLLPSISQPQSVGGDTDVDDCNNRPYVRPNPPQLREFRSVQRQHPSILSRPRMVMPILPAAPVRAQKRQRDWTQEDYNQVRHPSQQPPSTNPPSTRQRVNPSQ